MKVNRRAGATAVGIDEYGRGKNAMLQQILAAAGLTEAERASRLIKCPARGDSPVAMHPTGSPDLPRCAYRALSVLTDCIDPGRIACRVYLGVIILVM